MPSPEKRSLTLKSQLCSVKKACEYHGVVVPWEVQGYQKDFEVAESVGGLFDLSDYSVIEMNGKDSEDYLQRMTTVQFRSLDTNSVVHGAFLNGRGGVIAMGIFRKVASDSIQIIVLNSLKQCCLDHIEQFHFSEQFVVQDLSEKFSLLGCWSVDGKLSSQLGISSEAPPLQLKTSEAFGVHFESWKDVRRKSLSWIMIPSTQVIDFLIQYLKSGHLLLGARLFEYYRIKAGIPDAGHELTERDIILEGDFDEAVARNKGCYPGQEVVERIFTYGQVNRKLQRVTLSYEGSDEFPVPAVLQSKGKEVGVLVSVEQTPLQPNNFIGLMFVKKEFWGAKDTWVGPMGSQVKLVT